MPAFGVSAAGLQGVRTFTEAFQRSKDLKRRSLSNYGVTGALAGAELGMHYLSRLVWL